jgi:hypothetical protein
MLCTDLFGATAPVVVPNHVGQLLLIMSKAAARKIDFWFLMAMQDNARPKSCNQQ